MSLLKIEEINHYIIKAFIDNRRLSIKEKESMVDENKLASYLAMISNDYIQMFYASHVWHWNRYCGLQILKFPNDLWIMLEIIQEIKPDLIIECGSRNGASALWFADQLDINKKGEVVSIDIDTNWEMPVHDRITFIKGGSTFKEVVDQVKEKAEGKECVMVNLDSDHSALHVARELELYHPFVTKGSYLIVEDTIINHPIRILHTNGSPCADSPWEAVHEFLAKHPEFEIDYTKERFQITSNPHGYLRRCA